MNRFLQTLNFLGVAALAILCGFQWRNNSVLTHDVEGLEKTRVEQTEKIAEQDKAIKDDENNLDDLRGRLTTAYKDLDETRSKLAAMSVERDRLAVDRDHVKAAFDQSVAAIAARDDAIKKITEQAKKFLADRNEAVEKFNDLVGKYNDLVKSMNAKQQ